MSWTIHLRFLSGYAVLVKTSPDAPLEDLRQSAMKEMKANWPVRLVSPQGQTLTGLTVASAGLQAPC